MYSYLVCACYIAIARTGTHEVLMTQSSTYTTKQDFDYGVPLRKATLVHFYLNYFTTRFAIYDLFIIITSRDTACSYLYSSIRGKKTESAVFLFDREDPSCSSLHKSMFKFHREHLYDNSSAIRKKKARLFTRSCNC